LARTVSVGPCSTIRHGEPAGQHHHQQPRPARGRADQQAGRGDQLAPDDPDRGRSGACPVQAELLDGPLEAADGGGLGQPGHQEESGEGHLRGDAGQIKDRSLHGHS
jgi:hypothetical protein